MDVKTWNFTLIAATCIFGTSTRMEEIGGKKIAPRNREAPNCHQSSGISHSVSQDVPPASESSWSELTRVLLNVDIRMSPSLDSIKTLINAIHAKSISSKQNNAEESHCIGTMRSVVHKLLGILDYVLTTCRKSASKSHSVIICSIKLFMKICTEYPDVVDAELLARAVPYLIKFIGRSDTVSQCSQSPRNSRWSGSEFSDFNALASSSDKRLRADNDLLITVLMALQALIKASGKNIYSFWPTIFSEHKVASDQKGTLLGLVSSKSSIKLKVLATQTLSMMLEGSHTFMIAATNNFKKSSFASYSEKMCESIVNMHHTLLFALRQEEASRDCTEAVLDCLAILARNAPYKNINRPELLESCINDVANYMDGGSSTSAFLCTRAILLAASQCQQSHTFYKLCEKVIDRSILYAQRRPQDNMYSLNNDALFILIDIIPRYGLMGGRTLEFDNIANEGMQAMDCTTSLSVSQKKFIVLSLKAWQLFYEHCVIYSLLSNSWWQNTTYKYMQQLATTYGKDLDELRSISCDLMCLMSDKVFAEFTITSPKDYALWKSLSTGLSMDDLPSVRAAACRTLGSLALLPSVQSDKGFFRDIIESLDVRLVDNNLNVRVRSSWASANVCDALVSMFESNEEFTSFITTQGVVKLVRHALVLRSDNEKLRSNALRILGSCSRILDPQFLQREVNSLNGEIIAAICADSTHGMIIC